MSSIAGLRGGYALLANHCFNILEGNDDDDRFLRSQYPVQNTSQGGDEKGQGNNAVYK